MRFSARTGSVFRSFDAPFALAADTRSIVVGEGRFLIRMDFDHQKRIGDPFAEHQTEVRRIELSGDGRTAATITEDDVLSLWDIDTGRQIGGPLKLKPNGQDATFSPDGRLLAKVESTGLVRFLDTRTGQEDGSPIQVHERSGSVLFTPDGRVLASTSPDGVQLWDVATRKPIGGPFGVVSDVKILQFSPDGRMLAIGGSDKVVRFWDVAKREESGEPLIGFDSYLSSIAFSPDGQTVATGTFLNWQLRGKQLAVRMWDLGTRRQIGDPFVQHWNDVDTLAFSADGASLVSASNASDTILRWDTTSYPDPAKTICERVGPPSEKQWAKYSPGEPVPRPCG